MDGDQPGDAPGSWLHSQSLERDLTCASRVPVHVMVSGEPGVGKRFVARQIHERGEEDRPLVLLGGLTPLAVAGDVDTRNNVLSVAVGDAGARVLIPWGATVVVEAIDQLGPHQHAMLDQLVESNVGTPVGQPIRIVSILRSSGALTACPPTVPERLFYRLNMLHLRVPPLRERRSTIPRIVRHWLADGARRGLPAPSLTPGALSTLTAHTWPENMRELKAVMEHLATTSGGGPVSRGQADIAVGRRPPPDQAAVDTAGRVSA